MLVRIENLSFGPPGRVLGKKICFSLNAGELLHIDGPNGSGKSFLARTIVGQAAILAGKIVKPGPPPAFLPQMQNQATHLPFSLGDILKLEKLDADISGLLQPAQLELGWNKASGGERQKALLARFFSLPSSLLVMDEPFNHLDQKSRDTVRMLIRNAVSKKKCAVILISHERDPASWLGDVPVKSLLLPHEAKDA